MVQSIVCKTSSILSQLPLSNRITNSTIPIPFHFHGINTSYVYVSEWRPRLGKRSTGRPCSPMDRLRGWQLVVLWGRSRFSSERRKTDWLIQFIYVPTRHGLPELGEVGVSPKRFSHCSELQDFLRVQKNIFDACRFPYYVFLCSWILDKNIGHESVS